ncbi:unnamed protein product [Cyclocybe aegerita]|uniref:DUF7770 domain-containing protein n=1 Tax=Cyclocybe aegerita TaxID=1973307 RepID=A0A8S0WZB8_CYCAE|nr:unnamed protein product [Cyclocybe aegerita]
MSRWSTVPTWCKHTSGTPILATTLPGMPNRVTAIVATPASLGTEYVNHWRIFLALSDNVCIIFDPVKVSRTSTRLRLGIDARPYRLTNRGLMAIPFSLGAQQQITPYTIYQALHNNRLLEYRFTPQGRGCRFWIKAVVTFLAQNSFIAFSNPTLLQPYLVWKYRFTGRILATGVAETNAEPDPMPAGTFL